MRAFITALCVCHLLFAAAWNSARAADSPQNSSEISMNGSKSLAHIIDLSGAQEGMAPPKTDLPQALVGGIGDKNSGLPTGLRTN